MQNAVAQHYKSLAKSYNIFLYYSRDFVRALTRKMVAMLQLRETDRLADIGCGTGMYSLDILRQVPMRKAVLAVDPVEAMLDQLPAIPVIQPIHLDAISFASRDFDYNKALMKESIHHVAEKAELLRSLFERLPPGGRLLLVNVPPRLDYPLFDAALQRARGWHADSAALAALLTETGFGVAQDTVEFEHHIPAEDYFEMVEGRYMSVLSSFSDNEIKAGIEEMKGKCAASEMLSFVDHFDYLLGVKLS